MEPNLKFSVASLYPAERDGYLTKQGGGIKTWKKRWFVLKGKKLYYYKSKQDVEAKGVIELEQDSFVNEQKDRDKKRRYMFSVGTARRVYFIHSETETEMHQWVEAIKRSIEGAPNGNTPSGGDRGGNNGVRTDNTNTMNSQQQRVEGGTTGTTAPNFQNGRPTPTVTPSNATPRARLAAAKNCIPYLLEEQSKVLEFWQIWTESIPSVSDLQSGMFVEFHVAISADMQKLTWRTAGPQNIFIQKMVDFFWNVGAPESEIDRLNDVGALINPVKIGSWIDMSAKGGMDGGWYFPVEIPLKLAIDASDAGDPTRKVTEWGESHGTEIRLRLPGSDFSSQLRVAMDAFFAFGFPSIPEESLAVIRRSDASAPLCMSIITSSEGFVRLGLLIPRPSKDTVQSLCQLGQEASFEDISRFEASLANTGPAYVEVQYLMKGFGYGVYKEGFDIVLHYLVGEDHPE